MAYPYQLSFYKSDVVGAESDPNSVAPSANRIIQVPGDNNEAYSAILWIGDGTSLVVTLWFLDALSGVWIQLAAPVTVTTGPITCVDVPPAAKIFAQLGVNTGSVTKFGVGFVPGDVDLAGSAPLPSGAATAANQVTGNTSLSNINTKLPSLGTAIMTGSIPVTLASNDTLFSAYTAKFPAAATPADGSALGSVSKIAVQLFLSNGGASSTAADLARSGQLGVLTSFTGMQNVLSTNKFNATPLSLSDGNGCIDQVDSAGRKIVSMGTALSAASDSAAVTAKGAIGVNSTVRAATLVVYATGGGKLINAGVHNNNAALRYLQFHNTTTAPSASAVPVFSIPVPIAGYVSKSFPFGRVFATGITLALSSTQDTYTASADGWFDAEYEPVT